MNIAHLNYKQLEDSIKILIRRIERVIKREQWVKLCNLQNQLNVLYDLLDKLEQKEEDNATAVKQATAAAVTNAAQPIK